MPKNKVYIIGVAPFGASSLTRGTSRLINRAETIFGGKRLLAMFPVLNGDRIVINNNLAEITDLIRNNLGLRRMVVLASGDPDFYGIAGYLTGNLGKNNIKIIPNVSTIQIAFARIKESWEDAAFVSVHSRSIKDIIAKVISNDKICILTDATNGPDKIARLLLEHGIDDYQAFVCENLGEKDEKITRVRLARLLDMEFSPLNILILLRIKTRKSRDTVPIRRIGITDEEFYQRRPKAGFITKQEIRAVSLAKMRLSEESLIWDIGAGSGAVSIEASFIARKGMVYAIEKNSTDVAIIKKNLVKFDIRNIKVIHTFAPDGLEELPSPTSVFIGGSGSKMAKILDIVSQRLKPGGHVVINIVALENLNTAIHALKARGFTTDVIVVNIARSTDIKELTRFEALNPVYILTSTLKRGNDHVDYQHR